MNECPDSQTPQAPPACTCEWDPEFHRHLNALRGREDAGAQCVNPVYPTFNVIPTPPVCTSCLFGCPPW